MLITVSEKIWFGPKNAFCIFWLFHYIMFPLQGAWTRTLLWIDLFWLWKCQMKRRQKVPIGDLWRNWARESHTTLQLLAKLAHWASISRVRIWSKWISSFSFTKFDGHLEEKMQLVVLKVMRVWFLGKKLPRSNFVCLRSSNNWWEEPNKR